MNKKDFFSQLKDARALGATVARNADAWAIHQQRETLADTPGVPYAHGRHGHGPSGYCSLIPLGSDDADAAAARQQSMAEHPRRRNWATPEPAYRTGTRDHSLGQYSSRCTYTHWEYIPQLRSYGKTTRNRLYAHIGEDIIRLRAGRGYFWDTDSLGIRLVRNRDGEDFHPGSDDIREGFRHIARQLRDLSAKRRQLRREVAAETKAMGSVWVCPRDSVNAGNCAAGTRTWMRQNHINPGHTLGRYILAAENSSRTRRAIQAAIARAAREMSNGVCLLSDH